MSAPPEWTLGDSETTAPVKFQHPIEFPFARSIISDTSSSAKEFKMYGGRFAFDRTHEELLNGLLPSVVEIPSETSGADRVAALLKMLENESWSPRPGSPLVIERLLEILLVEVIRHQGDEQAQAGRNLIAGLADPQIAACLHALHDDPKRDWSVATLAKAAGLSRSVFAQHFCEIVGIPPMQYLLRWRMALAKEMIAHGTSISETAFACGYQSVSGFSVAFSRYVGCPPSHVRSTAA